MNMSLRVAAHWALLIHIYVSMAGLTLAVLFGATGLALNHRDSISSPQTTTSEESSSTRISSRTRTPVINTFAKKLGLRAAATDYHDNANQIQVTYAAPGARTLVTINREDGKAEVQKETRGFMGGSRCHKGFDTGTVWFWTIDLAAFAHHRQFADGHRGTLLALRARFRALRDQLARRAEAFGI